MKTAATVTVAIAALVWALMQYQGTDQVNNLLTGLSDSHQYKGATLQAAVTLFCLSDTPRILSNTEAREINTTGGDFDFEADGDIENEDYTKASIYSLLYSLYQSAGIVNSEHGVPYQFTFNTWGISPTEQFPDDPQRHGKSAYAGLVNFDVVQEKAKAAAAKGENIKAIEIGCGTGAGANLITHLIPNIEYLAIDMQQAAINTCNNFHRKCSGLLPPNCEFNPRLTCKRVVGGVGNNGNKLPAEDNSIDVVIISETHIADIELGPEEKAIFRELYRVLKPGGVFVWGNALPTRVWDDSMEWLPSLGLKLVGFKNHTQGAVQARDEDEARVNAYVDQLLNNFPVFMMPFGVGHQCRHVSDRLLKNFYRHPGTALYLRMVTGYDSYLHLAYQKPEKEQT